ncbi:MAG: hypothetical protein ACRDIF_03465 [Actinomycetota bacterium]
MSKEEMMGGLLDIVGTACLTALGLVVAIGGLFRLVREDRERWWMSQCRLHAWVCGGGPMRCRRCGRIAGHDHPSDRGEWAWP